jgi:hypothetical protein
MKKILFLFLVATAFVACNNNDSNDTTNNDVADSTVNTAPATDNVNGNIPDSTNTIDVGTNDGTVN